MNGVTGRMGLNQHLRRSIYAIMQQGGVKLSDQRSHHAASRCWSAATPPSSKRSRTNAAACPGPPISTPPSPTPSTRSTSTRRPPTAAPTPSSKAIAAGKHIYCEKPIADSLEVALDLLSLRREGRRQARRRAGQAVAARHAEAEDPEGPGLLRPAFFSVRGEFGYWVFEGDTVPAQRPSWNYRKEDGGGIIIDMLCHWRYVLDNLFGKVKAVSCLGATHIPTRWDEAGKPYECTADDSAYATFELGRRRHRATSIPPGPSACAATICSPCRWMAPRAPPSPACATAGCSTTAPRRAPSGIPISTARSTTSTAGRRCRSRTPSTTPSSVQWELFLRHVVKDEPFRWGLLEGAKGVQLAEKGIESWQKRAWVQIPDLR